MTAVILLVSAWFVTAWVALQLWWKLGDSQFERRSLERRLQWFEERGYAQPVDEEELYWQNQGAHTAYDRDPRADGS